MQNRYRNTKLYESQYLLESVFCAVLLRESKNHYWKESPEVL